LRQRYIFQEKDTALGLQLDLAFKGLFGALTVKALTQDLHSPVVGAWKGGPNRLK
jgi:hypothetical protein